jgi:enoyl-CoA hydratase
LATYRLPRYIGLGRAKRLILSGEFVHADEALAMGLVDYVVPLAEFEKLLEEIIEDYVRICSVATVKSKILCNRSFEMEYHGFLEKYFELQGIAQTSEDHAEARRAYLENRNPIFK